MHNRENQQKVIIFSDGGSRGNPGDAAIGAVISLSNKETLTLSRYIGKTTNNIAEYTAILEALKELRKVLGKNKAKKTFVLCYLDSELAVKQLNREYKVKNPNILELFVKLNNIIIDFARVEFEHVKREKNKKADKLVNEALDKQKIILKK